MRGLSVSQQRTFPDHNKFQERTLPHEKASQIGPSKQLTIKADPSKLSAQKSIRLCVIFQMVCLQIFLK